MKCFTKKLVIGLSAASILAFASAVSAQQPTSFGGWYNGFKTGYNQTSGDAIDSKGSWTLGYELGYDWQTENGFVFGLDGYYDYNGTANHGLNGNAGSVSIGSQAYGMDTKYGWADGPVQYYAKVGYGSLSGLGAANGSGSGLHGGLGIEYKFSPNWSTTFEWLYDKGNIGPASTNVGNNNFTWGFNYYF